MTDDPVVEARPLTCAACRRRIWWVVDGLNPNGVWLDEHRVHIWIDGHAHAPTMIEAIPLGVFDGANRYDTDDEHVLSLWARGETVDIRIPRLDTARDAVLPCPYCENIDGHSYDCPRPRGTARDAVPSPSFDVREKAQAAYFAPRTYSDGKVTLPADLFDDLIEAALTSKPEPTTEEGP